MNMYVSYDGTSSSSKATGLTEKEQNDVKTELRELLDNHSKEAVTDFIKDCVKSGNFSGGYFHGSAIRYNYAYSLLKNATSLAPAPSLSPEELKKAIADMKVGITYPFSVECFLQFFPHIKVIESPKEVHDYDLIIVPGGDDVNPKYYGEKNHHCSYNEDRDNKEVPIVQEAINNGSKIYAVCRGHQLVNILHSCTYLQDILYADLQPHEAHHPLEFVNEGILYKFFNNKRVVSTHHQGVFRVGSRRLNAVCYYKSVVEGCEGPNIITTQFHPEFTMEHADFFSYLKEWAFIK